MAPKTNANLRKFLFLNLVKYPSSFRCLKTKVCSKTPLIVKIETTVILVKNFAEAKYFSGFEKKINTPVNMIDNKAYKTIFDNTFMILTSEKWRKHMNLIKEFVYV